MSAIIPTTATLMDAFISTVSVNLNAEELQNETVVKAMLMMTQNGTSIPVVTSRNPFDGKRLQFSVNTSWYGNPVPCIKGTEFDLKTHGVTIYWYENGKLNKYVSHLTYFENMANLSFLTSVGFLKGKTIKEAFKVIGKIAEYGNAMTLNNFAEANSIWKEMPTTIRGFVSTDWFTNAIADAKGMVKKF